MTLPEMEKLTIATSCGGLLALVGLPEGGRCKNAIAFIVGKVALLLADNITSSYHIMMTETTAHTGDNYSSHS